MATQSLTAGQKETLIAVTEEDETEQQEEVGDPHGGGIKGMWKWFMADPFSRWPFLVFVIFGVLTIVWLLTYFFEGSFTGYLCAGLAAIAMSLYGASHFRTLLGLKEQVDRLHRLNNDFRIQNQELSQEVDNLSRAKTQLSGVKDNLRLSNTKLRENLKKFQQLDAHLKTLADSSIEGLAQLQQSSQNVMDRWKDNLIGHERAALNKVLDQVEYADGKQNMSKEEFGQFLDSLPNEWKKKFDDHNVTFESVAGDDNEIDFEEFSRVLDQVVEDKALGK